MDEELESTLKKIDIQEEYDVYNMHIYEAKINNIICYLVVCGVGKVNAARCAQILIDIYDIDGIINVGVAGGVSDNLKIGDIIVADKLVQHDFDITAFNHNKGYIPNVGVFMPCDENLSQILTNSLNKLKYNYYIGTIASGDIFLTDTKMSQKIHTKFNALCVEMEGAAIAQVCTLCNMPFIVIRSISDIPNNDNTKTYEEFLQSSSDKLSNVIIDILNTNKR